VLEHSSHQKRTGKEKQTCLCLIVICHIAIPKIGI
jgi:hypothetical protein